MSNRIIFHRMARTFRVEMIVAVFISAMTLIHPLTDPIWVKIEQSRIYRDWVGLTPYRSVRPEVISIQGGVMTVMGTLIKQRDCEIVERSVWVRDTSSVLHEAVFQSGPVPGLPPARRYVSDDRQAFGPIIIKPPPGIEPVGAVMFATHDCYVFDENGERLLVRGQFVMERQSNVFFDVRWESKP